MQGKGFVKFLLVALTAVCVLQYIYMIPTYRVEQNADRYAQRAVSNLQEGSPEQISAERTFRGKYLDSMSSEKIFSIPMLKDFTYSELKGQNLALGLDLKGGYSVVLQVNMKVLVEDLSGKSKDPTFLQALDNAEEALKSSQSDYVSLFVQEFRKIADGKSLARIFMAKNSKLRDEISTDSSDGDIQQLLREKTSNVVSLTFTRLKQRIDKLGVSQPNVTLDAARDLILVELPGIDNAERAQEFLTASAKLEFWDTWNLTDPGIYPAFAQADELLKNKYGLESVIATQYDTTVSYVTDSLGTVIDSTENIVEVANPQVTGGPLLSVLSLYPQIKSASAGVVNRNQRTCYF